MTHDQVVAALRRGYQLDDARESRRGCYPIRKPARRTTGQASCGTLRSLTTSRTRPGSAKVASSEAVEP